MKATGVLIDAFSRIQDSVQAATNDLDTHDLEWQPDPDANSIGWLVWHLTRVQDDHVADAFNTEQSWIADQWWQRFGLDLPAEATGYGARPADVAKVRGVSADSLMGYHHRTCARTIELLRGAGDDDLDRVVDDNWDPPVTLGARLVSVVADDLQHVGQAAYLRGLLPPR